jgi:hypothetical protein
MRVDRSETSGIRGGGPEPDVAVRTNEHGAIRVEPRSPRIPCGPLHVQEVVPPLLELRKRRLVGAAEEEEVMPGAAKRSSIRIAIARPWGGRHAYLRTDVLSDDRASFIRDVQHRARASYRRGFTRCGWRVGHTRPRRLDSFVYQRMQPVGDLEDVTIGRESLRREALH